MAFLGPAAVGMAPAAPSLAQAPLRVFVLYAGGPKRRMEHRSMWTQSI